MAAPTRNLFTALAGNTGTASYAPDLTAQATGSAVGDCIQVFVAVDGNPTLSLGGTSAADGWSLVTQLADATNACKAALFRFTVAVAGTVPALTISSTASEAFVAQAIRIRPAAASALVHIAPTTASGSSTNPDPAAIVNGSGGARDILYIAYWAGDGVTASTAAPANYANHQSATISNAANGSSVGSADRTVNAVANAGSENPGTFTRATEQWAAISTAIYQVGVHSFVANNLVTGSPVLDAPALTQAHVLAASPLVTAAPALGSPALTQAHALTANALTTSSPVLGSPALVVVVSLVANNLTTGAPVLGAPTLTQAHALTADNLVTGSPALGSPALSQLHSVVANALATAAPVLDAPTLTQAHVIAASSLATAAPVLGSPPLTQTHVLAANDLVTGSPALGSPVLTSGGSTLVANDLVTGSPVLGSPVLTQRHGFVANNLATGPPALGSPALVVVVSFVANNLATGSPALDSPALAQTHAMVANDLTTGPPALATPVLHQRHVLVANDLVTEPPDLAQPPLGTSIWAVLPENIAVVGERSRVPLPGGPRFRGVLPSRHRDRIARPIP